MRRVLGLAVLVALTVPAGAAADGLPLPVENTGPDGIADAGGQYRYVSIKAGRDTLVERIEQDGGAVSDSIRLDGLYTIPAVGLDGSPGGLSADGKALVLIRPRPSFPRQTTEFVRFYTQNLRRPHEFRLRGDFSFDALSPDGRTMYLINYVSRDPTEYHVRAYDLERGRLEPGAIVDPDEPDDEMYGFALSRVNSADGRWAYTLYWGTEHPFVHALDTERGTAVCVDLDSLEDVRDMYSLGLDQGVGGSDLVVTSKGAPVAIVDTETYEVGAVPTGTIAAVVSEAIAKDDRLGRAPVEWVAPAAIATGVAMFAAAGLLASSRRRRAIA